MINPAPIIMYTFCLINSPHLINPPSPMPPLLYPNAFFSPFGFQQPTEGAPHHHVCSSVPWQTIPFQADPCFSLWLPMLSSVSWHGHVSPSSWVCKSHVGLSFILGLWHSVLGYLQWVLPPWLHLSSDTHIWLPFHMPFLSWLVSDIYAGQVSQMNPFFSFLDSSTIFPSPFLWREQLCSYNGFKNNPSRKKKKKRKLERGYIVFFLNK